MLALLVSAAWAACPTANPPPGGWVDLATVPGLVLDIRYATADNFTGAPLPGYGAPAAWLRAEAARALGRAAARLQAEGYILVVYDAYRPKRASAAMWDWAEAQGRTDLFADGWIARKSGHNQGGTVDVGLLDAAGAPLDLGTPFDSFVAASHAEAATGAALERRHALRDAMKAEGFAPYAQEWWHFRYPLLDALPIDVPYGACEPAP